MKKYFIIGGFLLACTASAYSQNGDGYWKRLQKSHPETTLETLQKSQVVAIHTPKGEIQLPAYRLSLTFEGQTRNITLETIKLMKAQGLTPGQIRKFRKEMLFSSADQEIWLPVKTDLLGQLEIELRQDEPVLLYTTVVPQTGAQPQQTTLLVEDFQVK